MEMTNIEMYNDLVNYRNELKNQSDILADQIWKCEWNTIEEMLELSVKLDEINLSIENCENEIKKVIEFFGGSIDGK